jgi:hypothetical protein
LQLAKGSLIAFREIAKGYQTPFRPYSMRNPRIACIADNVCNIPLGVGLGTEFRSEKIPRNRLGMVSVIPRKKVLIPKHSEFCGRASSEARDGTEWARKWSRQSTHTGLLCRHQSDSSQDILWMAKLGQEGSSKGKWFIVRTVCQWRLLPISLPIVLPYYR